MSTPPIHHDAPLLASSSSSLPSLSSSSLHRDRKFDRWTTTAMIWMISGWMMTYLSSGPVGVSSFLVSSPIRHCDIRNTPSRIPTHYHHPPDHRRFHEARNPRHNIHPCSKDQLQRGNEIKKNRRLVLQGVDPPSTRRSWAVALAAHPSAGAPKTSDGDHEPSIRCSSLIQRLQSWLRSLAEKWPVIMERIRPLLFRSSSRKVGRTLRWVVLAGSLTFLPRPAQAEFSHEMRQHPIQSIRPGMTPMQVERVLNTDQPPEALSSSSAAADEILSTEEETVSSSSGEKQVSSNTRGVTRARKAAHAEADDEVDDDFDLDDDDDDEDVGVKSSSSVLSLSSLSRGVVPTQKEQARAQLMQSSTRSQFAGVHQGRSAALTAKVAAAFFVPTYGFMIVREYVRRRREEEYVRKGLEILEAQKAEYFNVTSSAQDADLQDELKGLKDKNETDSDDDDDDDDDDEDGDGKNDQVDPKDRSSKRPPKKPRGDGGGGGSGGGSSPAGGSEGSRGRGPSAGGTGGGADPGYGRPSEDDLDRLNRLFGKS